MTKWFKISATLMFAGIALGAFGAHFLPKKLGDNFNGEVWDTAVLYQLIHALALFAFSLSGVSIGRVAPWAWLAGIFCFSGSLYGLAVNSNLSFLGPVTPLGGVLFMTGWACLIFRRVGN